MTMMNTFTNKRNNEEAVLRLPISMSRLNGIIFILFAATLTCLFAFRAAAPISGTMAPYSVLGSALLLYSMSIVSAILFFYLFHNKYWSDPMVGFLCAALFFFLQGSLCLLCLGKGSTESLQQAAFFWQAAACRCLKATLFPVAAGCLLLAISNLVLFAVTGLRPVNLLGLLFAVLSLLIHFLLIQGSILDRWAFSKYLFLHFGTGTSFCISYLELYFLSCLLCDLLLLSQRPSPPVNYIIIPGCRVWPDGTMSLSLRRRIERAFLYEEEQFRLTGQHAVFLPSGGTGSDAPFSEAEAMKKYLLSQGVSEDYILPEDQSTTTYENLLFSRTLLADHQALSTDPDGKPQTSDHGSRMPRIIICSADYHLLRCLIIARELNLPAEGIFSRSRWYIYANAGLREYLALLYRGRTQHLFLLALIWISFSLLSFLG